MTLNGGVCLLCNILIFTRLTELVVPRTVIPADVYETSYDQILMITKHFVSTFF